MAIVMLTRAILFKFHWRAPHETIYGHKKKMCLEQNISIGSFHASFHNFYNVFVYVKWPQKLVMKDSIAHSILTQPELFLTPVVMQYRVT